MVAKLPAAKPAQARGVRAFATQTFGTLKTMAAAQKRGLELMVGAGILLVGLALGAAYFWGGTSHPSTAELAMLYPYGKAGGRLPNGRAAPSMGRVAFTLVGQEDCEGVPCLRYQVTEPGTPFEMEMLVERPGAAWQLAPMMYH